MIFPIVLLVLIANAARAIVFEELLEYFETNKCIQGTLSELHLDKFVKETTTYSTSNDLEVSAEELALFNSTNKNKYDKTILSIIHELATYNGIEYEYELTNEEGPSHSTVFKVKLTLGDEVYLGEGASKKEAQRMAAIIAVDNTKYELPPIKVTSEEQVATLTPTVKLNNIAAKLGFEVKYYLFDKNKEFELPSGKNYNFDENKPLKTYLEKLNESIYHPDYQKFTKEETKTPGPFNVKVKVDGEEFLGFGHTIQSARHDAALKAIQYYKTHASESVCLQEGLEKECVKNKEKLKSAVSRVYELGQKRKLFVDFEIVNQHGPDHKKVFETKCTLGDFIVTAEGNSKKESKRLAAEKMLNENSKFLPQIDNDVNEIVSNLKPKSKKKKKNKNKLKSKDASIISNIIDGVSNFMHKIEDGVDFKNNKIKEEEQNTHEKLQKDDGKPNNKKQPKSKHNLNKDSAKQSLLKYSNSIKIEVNFMDLGQKGTDFYTLLSLSVNPPYVCLGKAITKESSENNASLEGLKLLYKSGLSQKSVELENILKMLEEVSLSSEGFPAEETYITKDEL